MKKFHHKILFLDAPVAFISILGNRLTCHADGNPRPSIEWLLPDGGVLLDTNSVYLEPSMAENGYYTCKAYSPLKPDSLATLDVQKSRDLRKCFIRGFSINFALVKAD